MSEPVPEMRWWGWGDAAREPALPPHALGFLRSTVGIAEHPRPPVALENVELPGSALDGVALERLASLLADDALRTDHLARVQHAAGKSYPDLVRIREGRPDGAPDAIAYPQDSRQLAAVLEACEHDSIAVVPFGGGTSVVGGLAPLRGEHRAVVALDTSRIAGVRALDRESATVTVGGGMRAPALERELAAQGLTLGHYPQSYEYVSLGGCAATRSAGQASTGYGAIEKMVLGFSLTAPGGRIALPAVPATAAGPGVRQLVVGSEGTLGVIDELHLRVRPAAQERVYVGVFFENFAAGVEALRTCSREHVLPDVARLSDEHETSMSMALAGSGGLKGRIGRTYLGLRGYREGCLAILGFEGSAEDVNYRRGRALALAHGCAGISVGRSAGEAWRHGRFAAPYLRDDLLTQGVMVETLETATQWSNLHALHAAVGDAIGAALAQWQTPAYVMCHVSHVYETGASLYFTFLARQSVADPIGQWRAVKTAASDAIVTGGGTITHHHAVGLDHAPWMEREVGESALAMLSAAKAELDPRGIMNPGKLGLASPIRA
ncbi:MAG TPA: FAD-binding oxidoreductase [Solirubrobacteraceae bacterium]|nr:FAD-binding oxidoreductase [Solirubrobacteraceae bacterium]